VVSVTATDAAGNQTTGTFKLNVLPPSSPSPFVVSITPTSPFTNGRSVNTVTFSQVVTGVDASDFQLVRTGTVAGGAIQVTPVNGSVYMVTVSGVTGNGTLGVNLVDNGTIHNGAGRPLAPLGVFAAFQNQQVFSNASSSSLLAMADVNGDGKNDLIVGNKVLLNTTITGSTAESFAPEQVVDAMPAFVNSLAVGDLNGDGKPDLIYGNGELGRIVMRLNTTPTGTASVSFGPDQLFGQVSDPRSLAIGDVNGDGKPDVIVGSYGDRTIGVLLNTTSAGTGVLSFAAQTSFALFNLASYHDGPPKSVALADIDNDGRPDIVVANSSSYTVSVLQNYTPTNGTTPDFLALPGFASGDVDPSPLRYSMAIADLNGDAKQDVIVVDKTDVNRGGAEVLRNISFSDPNLAAPQYVPGGGSSAATVLAGDINGDGKPDLVLLSDTLSTLLNTTPAGSSNPTFAESQPTVPVYFGDSGLMGDLNGDAKPDVVTLVSGGTGVTPYGVGVFLNAYNADFAGETCSIDTTPPQLTLPADQTFKAPSAQGVLVHYVGATATDNVTAHPAITYSLAQNSLLPVGTTVVTATATDAVGNQTTGTFNIIVTYTPPTASIGDLPPDSSIGDNTVAVFSASAVHPLNPDSTDVFTFHWTVSQNGILFAEGTDPYIVFVPLDNGTDLVTLTATDSDGATSAPATAAITVVNAPPIASIQVYPLPLDSSNTPTAPAGMLLTFNASASDSLADMQQGFRYSWSVTRDGAPYPLLAGTVTDTPTFTFAPDAAGSYGVTVAVTDKDGGCTIVTQALAVTSISTDRLQSMINLLPDYSFFEGQSVMLTLQSDSSHISSIVDALNGVVSRTGYSIEFGYYFVVPVVATLNLVSGSYHDVVVNLQPDVTLIVNGVDGSATFVGGSPAFTVKSGNVIVQNATFQNATNAPTILVTGGSLTLRNDLVQESAGYNQAAIQITGGSVDLGAAADPGGNTINVNGAGDLIRNAGPNSVSAIGNTFRQDGTTIASPYRIEDKVFHALDSGGGGLVTWTAGNVYVTQSSGSIQRGVAAVTAGGTVNVEPGSYTPYAVGAKLLTIAFQGGPTLLQRADDLNPGLTALVVTGTSGVDNIGFNPNASAGSIDAGVNNLPNGTFAPTGRLVAYGLGGDDNLQVSGSISLPAWLYGGDGNDRLNGGNGPNVLLGGAGNDSITGGSSRDLIIGGIGADQIVGNGGDDLMIGGTTAFDGNDTALAAIEAEWTSSHDFAARIANLSGVSSNPGFAGRLNGNYFLIPLQTAFADGAVDSLTGSSGSDWYIADAVDQVNGANSNDRVTRIGP
jgi:hypothetical protein